MGLGAYLRLFGAGHLKGLEQNLRHGGGDADEIIDELSQIPVGSKWVKRIPWLIVALVVIGCGFGFYRSPALGWTLVVEWVVINGGLSALGAAIAGGHILTVVSAFIAAPITSLNPTIGAGFVTALVESYLRKPDGR